MRGNPWSNVSSQYPTPPKPPTSARKTQPPQPPPPSSGAERYRKNFQAPPASAYQAAQEGPQARKATYEGWENLRHSKATEHGPGKTWKSPQPPPRGTPTSGREESNARSQRPVPPRPESSSQHQRSHSSSAASRKGFMPNTPGGDEPPAPRGNYFTQRDKPSVAPDLPARDPPPSTHNASPDPLRQFRPKAMPTMEPRLSTPYATQGGEKFNPFESANINRSKSTRERTDTSDPTMNGFSPTTDDPRFKPPHRARSFAERTTPRNSRPYAASVDDTSDEEVRPPRSSHRYRSTTPQQPRGAPPQPDPTTNDPSSSSKPSKVSQFRQWMKENPNTEPPPNGFPPDGPPLRSGQAKTDANGNPSMYENSSFFSRGNWFNPARKQSSFENSLPTVAESSSSIPPFPLRSSSMKLPSSLKKSRPTTPPSGVTLDPKDLNAFETLQRNVVDGLLSSKRASTGQMPQTYTPTGLSTSRYSNQGQPDKFDKPLPSYPNIRSKFTYKGCAAEAGTPSKINSRFAPNELSPAEAGSPTKKSKHLSDDLCGYDTASERRDLFMFDLKNKNENNANHYHRLPRFNFDFPNGAFATTQPPKNSFSSSAENISTNFTPEYWEGKFEAGGDYFKPDPKAGPVPSPARGRAQSGSRSRGRSPIKVRSGPGDIPSFAPPTEPTPTESPGAKFSAEEWHQTFKSQTFAPPPRTAANPLRKRTPTLRTTLGGKAAVVDDGSSSNEDKPLFTGRKPTASPTTITPDPMDVDTPPANHTVPQFTASKINEKLSEAQKRPAESAPSTPTDTADLKVGLDDLRIKDLITSLNMPQPPKAPAPPAPSEFGIPTQLAYDNYVQRYATYTAEWDHFSSKFLLHMVTRKNNVAAAGSKRWIDEVATEHYRLGLKEDQVVLQRWVETMAAHEGVVREFCVVRERMKGQVGGESSRASLGGKRASPRKKTH
jgi:hypothetical protein